MQPTNPLQLKSGLEIALNTSWGMLRRQAMLDVRGQLARFVHVFNNSQRPQYIGGNCMEAFMDPTPLPTASMLKQKEA